MRAKRSVARNVPDTDPCETPLDSFSSLIWAPTYVGGSAVGHGPRAMCDPQAIGGPFGPPRRSWAGFRAAAIAACEHSPAQHVARVPGAARPRLQSFRRRLDRGRATDPARRQSPPAASIHRSGDQVKTEFRFRNGVTLPASSGAAARFHSSSPAACPPLAAIGQRPAPPGSGGAARTVRLPAPPGERPCAPALPVAPGWPVRIAGVRPNRPPSVSGIAGRCCHAG